ncbi:MAG: hypothetical protein RIB86_22965 [Imperialibacter sp.]
MNKELIYRNIAFISAIMLIFGLFINFRETDAEAIVDLVFALVTLNSVIFAFLWLRNVVLLIGYFLYLVSFNFELLISPLFADYAVLGSTTFFFS